MQTSACHIGSVSDIYIIELNKTSKYNKWVIKILTKLISDSQWEIRIRHVIRNKYKRDFIFTWSVLFLLVKNEVQVIIQNVEHLPILAILWVLVVRFCVLFCTA